MVTQINLRYVGRTIQQYINFGKFWRKSGDKI